MIPKFWAVPYPSTCVYRMLEGGILRNGMTNRMLQIAPIWPSPLWGGARQAGAEDGAFGGGPEGRGEWHRQESRRHAARGRWRGFRLSLPQVVQIQTLEMCGKIHQTWGPPFSQALYSAEKSMCMVATDGIILIQFISLWSGYIFSHFAASGGQPASPE